MKKPKLIFLISVLVTVSLISCSSKLEIIDNKSDSINPAPRSTIVAASPSQTNTKELQNEKKSRQDELYEKMIRDNQEMCNGELEAIKGRNNRNLNPNSKEIEINEYKKIIEEGCDTASSRTYLGLAFKSDGRFEESVEQFRIVTKRYPKDWAAHWTLARILIIELHQYEEGLREIQASKSLDNLGDLSHNYDYHIGKAQDGLGNYVEAIKHYKIFIKEQTKINSSAPNLLDAKQRVSAIESK